VQTFVVLSLRSVNVLLKNYLSRLALLYENKKGRATEKKDTYKRNKWMKVMS